MPWLPPQDSCTTTQEGCRSQPSSTSTSIGNCARESKICNWTPRPRIVEFTRCNLKLGAICDVCIDLWFLYIFVTCARWAPSLIQQAEHWRLCKSHLVFGFLEEVKMHLICPAFQGAFFFDWFCSSTAGFKLVFFVYRSLSEGAPFLLKVRVADDEWHSSVAEGSSPAWMASDHHCFWYYDMRQTLGSGRRS